MGAIKRTKWTTFLTFFFFSQHSLVSKICWVLIVHSSFENHQFFLVLITKLCLICISTITLPLRFDNKIDLFHNTNTYKLNKKPASSYWRS